MTLKEKGTMTVKDAGRLGGLTVLRKRGNSWFAEIGLMGQKAMKAKYSRMAREWGKRGGRPRKPNLSCMREADK